MITSPTALAHLLPILLTALSASLTATAKSQQWAAWPILACYSVAFASALIGALGEAYRPTTRYVRFLLVGFVAGTFGVALLEAGSLELVEALGLSGAIGLGGPLALSKLLKGGKDEPS